MKKLVYLIYNLLIKFFIALSITPHFWKVIYIILNFGLFIFRYRSKVIDKNLSIAFQNSLTAAEKKKMTSKIHSYLAYETSYLFRLLHLPKKKLTSFIETDASSSILEICRKQQAVILLSGHTFGFWISALFSCCFRKAIHYTYHSPERHSFAIYTLMRKSVCRFGTDILPQSKNDTFKMAYCLKNKHCLNILGDLNASKTSTFVDFFGKKASFGEGAFRLALKMNVPIIYGWVEEIHSKKLILHLREIYLPQKEQNKPSVLELVTRYKQNLEMVIKKKPHYYLWSNKRWKTRPEGDDEIVYP